MQNFCWTHMERQSACSGCEEQRRQEESAELIQRRSEENNGS